jgi:asparagine synthase (glutamine-hydrolysing)
MHGFFGSYNYACEWDWSLLEDRSLIQRQMKENAFCLTQFTLPKFLNDKCFETVDDCFLAVEGVLLEADSPADAIARYRKGETCFWDNWRGSFAGVLYDKEKDVLILFNDHIGSKMLFYAQVKDGFVFASDLRILARAIDAHTLNNNYALAILDKGCSADNNTFVEGIHRLTAGQYLQVCGKSVQIAEYHRFDNTPWPYDEKAMIDETNRRFRQAVERVIRKNEQEGLRHFYPLSGGLDSRMTQWVARQMTEQPITNFTFSQTGHYDHLLPQQISKHLGNQWLFTALDGGDYILDVEGSCAHTQWLVNYMLPIEIDFFARQQDWQDVGVVLTGINGDNIFATETDNAHEMARIYTHGFNGFSLGSPLVMQHYTESYSPFCDVDVLDYVLHVPTHKRRNYYFYDCFVLRCYPEAAQWHHKHMQIGHRPTMVTILGRNILLRDVAKRIGMSILKHLHIYDAYRVTKEESMNPYDYWAQENPAILATMQSYYEEHRDLLVNHAWLTECEEKMRFGSVMEKGKVLTIQSALMNLRIS